MVLRKVNSPTNPFLASSPLSMCHDIPVTAQPQSEQTVQHSRDLAWQIAPNLLKSFKYAWAGLCYAFITQRNFRIHTLIGTLALSLSLLLNLAMVEVAVITMMTGLVLALELLNTALESVVDLTVKQTYHELAKIAKDCSAGAVLVSAIASVIIAGSLIAPPLLTVVRELIS